MVDFLHPHTLKRLREAGATSPKSPIAIALALPWLLGRGPSLGIVSRMNAFVLGDKPAIHDRNGTVSFKELDARSNQTANALRQLGMRGSDRVSMLLRNGREIVEVALGAQKLGLVAAPLNTWAKTKELKVTLEEAHPAVLVYDTQHAKQVASCDTQGIQLVHVGDDDDALEGSVSYEDLIGEQSASPPPPFTRDRGSPRIIIHTSGTTGKPKGAQRSPAAAGIGALANVLAIVPYKREDIIFCPAPMFHSFGLATMVFGMALGTTMVLPEKFDPEDSLRMIEDSGATAASFVPVMIKRIVSLDDDIKKKYDLSNLRVVLASGSAISPELRSAAMDLFGDVLYDLYGSTEIGWTAIASPEAMRAKPKTIGKPVRGIEVAVFDKDGNWCKAGDTGELYVKSDILFEGYTSGESKDVREGYMSIGDLGHFDDDGYLYIDGRADDMVVIGGENVYPIEVEELIESLDGVEEAAVLGIEDEEFGEVLAAFVVGSASEQDIANACKAELASYKVPRRIEKVDELPRTSTGKVVKRRLIEPLDGAEPLDD
jgi:fatty-acyl-CoA synthase